MKGLEEWLASSSSSDTTNRTATATAATDGVRGSTIARTDVRQRQEEMRERVRKILGDSAVSSVVSSTTPALAGVASVASPISGDDNRTAVIPSTSLNIVAGDGVQGSSTAAEARVLPGEVTEYRRVEVMVVDRGTQTTTTVGCQTDPIPEFTNAQMPYSFGFQQVAGPFRCCCCCHGKCGIQRRPSSKLLTEDENISARFKSELETIQTSIDLMIARYNLPPPPLPLPRTA
ncbi:hypothetical protein ERJ75_000723000 [Trypanosoma vivax]|nr:hypothetical protein TRVL_03061 [Trypanosoma vivax]KAH8614189.1 hypothetical protein ERJ75_000723000 [Trypanosoma vivax]